MHLSLCLFAHLSLSLVLSASYSLVIVHSLLSLPCRTSFKHAPLTAAISSSPRLFLPHHSGLLTFHFFPLASYSPPSALILLPLINLLLFKETFIGSGVPALHVALKFWIVCNVTPCWIHTCILHLHASVCVSTGLQATNQKRSCKMSTFVDIFRFTSKSGSVQRLTDIFYL